MTATTTIPGGRISELVRYFLRLGCLGFGGPVALVGQMERELVDERKWLTREQMRESIAVCQSLRGGSPSRWASMCPISAAAFGATGPVAGLSCSAGKSAIPS